MKKILTATLIVTFLSIVVTLSPTISADSAENSVAFNHGVNG